MKKLLRPLNLLFLGVAYMAYGWKGLFWMVIMLFVLGGIVASNKDALEKLVKTTKKD